MTEEINAQPLFGREACLRGDVFEVVAECDKCRGTGVYSGFAEPEGVGVICLFCKGSGAQIVYLRRFKGRKRREDIRLVKESRGTSLAVAVGPDNLKPSITYDEFWEKVPKVAYVKL